MMKLILKAGPNQMETLRQLRADAAAIDKDVTVHSDQLDRRVIFVSASGSVKKRCNRNSLHHRIRIHRT